MNERIHLLSVLELAWSPYIKYIFTYVRISSQLTRNFKKRSDCQVPAAYWL